MITIALDVMSGDLGAGECIPAALLSLRANPQLQLQLVGDESTIRAALAQQVGRDSSLSQRIAVIHASEIITMDDSPREAIRRKKQSSMRLAIDQVHAGSAQAAVSAGNTGALTAIAHFVLKCLPEVERAPIMSAVPNVKGMTHVLDLGANVRATALQLEQFAIMGAIVARDVHGIARPRVGLLNIGEEEQKGNDLVQEAHARLLAWREGARRETFDYYGFVEGHDIFGGEVDVVVTDGFTGNVALKTMEGLAGLISSRLRQEFTADLPSKLAALMARPVLKRVSQSLDPRRYNGAVMVGLRQVVVKSHGGADRVAMSEAIRIASTAVSSQLVRHVESAFRS
ncbi:MAG: phosphate acyltransferase PlsX [Gammaproteobacteria bacterium]|jgi:glycerol-3-phosphate acyltransferase PlsX|nr:phosphate acyltransferase PlsX [Gammaproteobacteria bacterium]